MTLEICANSIESAIAAAQGGADRIELCTNLTEGGTTPSFGQIKWCVTNLGIDVWPLIRPRGGDFVYSDAEFSEMLLDVENCKKMGCHGVVTGILLADGTLDELRCKQLVAAAQPMPVTFHRAFDRCTSQTEALEVIIKLGFVRILTSGGKADAHLGAKEIAKLIRQAEGRIEIMPGAGINADNILEIAQITGAISFHTSAKVAVPLPNNTHTSAVELSDAVVAQTDLTKVKILRNVLQHLTNAQNSL